MVPGLTTLVSNLLSTFSDQDEKKLLRGMPDRQNTQSWVTEYIDGCCYEIYRFRIAENLDGLAFATVAQILQEQCNSILFAMLEDSTPFAQTGAPDQRSVQLFPADRHVRVGDYCYVLARNFQIGTQTSIVRMCAIPSHAVAVSYPILSYPTPPLRARKSFSPS